MKVNLVFRKANPLYFSIEKVFETLIPHFPAEAIIKKSFLKSARANLEGIYQNLSASVPEADVHHVTGDVHYMALAFPSRKTLLTIHDCVFMNTTAGIKRWIMKWLWLKLPVKKSQLVTVISEATKQDVIKYTHCKPSKIVVVPDPVASHFKLTPKTFSSQHTRILQVGTWPNKNLERVIPALEGIDAQLIIIGKLNDAQLQLLSSSGIRFNNYFNLTEEELAAEYAAADLLLFASTYEGFGLPIVEAQSTGRVVITSNLPPMSDVAGGAALLVDPFDVQSIRTGVLEAIHNKEKRERLIELGLQNVKQYTAENIALQYYHLYKQLITG